jgi:hypothetical protein
MDVPQISALAGIAALRACGHPGRSTDAPAPIAGYALAFSAAVTGLAVAAQTGTRPDLTDWTGAPSEQIAQALYSVARDGLIPGGISDPGATAYIFKGKGSPAPTGRPSPRGRLAMARAAGVDVRTVTVGKADQITLDDSGDVSSLTLDPDARPASWGDLRGVVIHVDDMHTGARRSLWIARADLAERKAKAGQKSAWDTDAVGMALTKAVAIAIARGAVPQASLIPAILAACAAHPAPARPLAIEATTPRQIAEAPPQPMPAPPTQADPEPTPEPARLTIYTARDEVWSKTDPVYRESAEEALSTAFAMLQIESRRTGEAVERDNLTPEQHRWMVDRAVSCFTDQATDPAPTPRPAPVIADDIVGDLAADAECRRNHAERAIDVAIEALRADGRAHHDDALRSPPVWKRLIQRAAELARADEDAAHNA